MTEQYLFAFANLVLCAPSFFICICRLNAMQRKKTRVLVQIEYAFGAAVLLLSALRPLINEWPGYASLAMATYVLVSMVASRHAWRNDTPPVSASIRADLRAADGSNL